MSPDRAQRPPGELLLVHLDDCLARLREADTDDDRWMRTSEVLGCLYQLEESEKRPDAQSYFAHLNASPDGRTLGGLIYVRGLVVHHTAEVRDLVLRPAPIQVVQGGKLVDAELYVAWEGELRLTRSWVGVRGWPQRSALPADVHPDRRGRGRLYDEHVAGEALMTPLEAAARYLHGRRGPAGASS